MRVVIQRVARASVTVNGDIKSAIKSGLLILLGIQPEDSQEDINWMVKKISQLRIFPDEQEIMNKSVVDITGEMLIIPQFTLFASTKKGNRPSYIKAARPNIAIPLYENFVSTLQTTTQLTVGTGVFGAGMKVDLLNDGPVTIIIDSKNRE